MEAAQKTSSLIQPELRVIKPVNQSSDSEFLKKCIEEKDLEIIRLRQELQVIQNSLGFKILKRLPKIDFLNKALLKSLKYAASIYRNLKPASQNLGSVELNHGYQIWISENEPTLAELQDQTSKKFHFEPKISIITPTWNTPKKCLVEMIESVINQTYKNWELCIADGNSTSSDVLTTLRLYQQKDPRIKIKFLEKNLGIAGNTNAALELATGDFIGLLDHDDTLAPFALFEVASKINESPATLDVIYSDEDMITGENNQRFSPVFKPDFGWDTIRSHNYICHFLVIRNHIIKELRGFRSGFDGSQDYDLVLRACELSRKISHIPKVLYHWRVHPASTAGNPAAKNYAHDAGRRALQEHLDRTFGYGQAANGKATGLYQAIFHHANWPKISIIIPSRDEATTLNTCIQSILRDDYPNFEIIILENGSKLPETFKLYESLKNDSRIRIENWTKPFSYAAINNFGSQIATGEILLFLNNDMESLSGQNLRRMAEHAIQKETGIVGAALFYPDQTVQHAGVTLAMTGIAGHTMRNTPRGKLGYGFRLATIRNQTCVTGAALMICKDLFKHIGGFDENLAIAFNDIDLCLKVKKQGYNIVWTPYAEFTHYESKTRGAEDSPEKKARFQNEINYFRSKWEVELNNGDPHYSPNLSSATESPTIKIKG